MSTKISPRDKDIITKSFKLLSRGVPTKTVIEDLDWGRYFNVFSSSIGDNRYINPIPQSSPATDPRYGRFMQSKEGGMGSLYKEVHEDNNTLLTIIPGVPEFAGLLSFINNMFNPTAAIIANKGRAPGLAFKTAEAAGAVLFWPMQLVSISLQTIAFLTNSPGHNFYTVKPTMGAYTMAANGVLNDIMVKLGFVDPVLPTSLKGGGEEHSPLYGKNPGESNAKSIKFLQELMPDVIVGDGTIDLMRLITKGARKHRYLLNALAKLDEASPGSADGKLISAKKVIENATKNIDTGITSGYPTKQFVEKEMASVGRYRGPGEGANPEGQSAYHKQSAYSSVSNEGMEVRGVGNVIGEGGSFADKVNEMTSLSESFPAHPTGVNPNEPLTKPKPSTDPNSTATTALEYYEDNPSDNGWLGNVKDLIKTAAYGGLDAITWRVEGGFGSVSDSFSNSTTTSPMASKFNSITKQANNFMFDIAGGATGIGIVDGVVNMIKDVGMGALSGSVLGNIPLALANNAYIKVPDHWDGSTTDLHKESYTLYFDCTYAHPYEQIMKIWVPFSLLLPLVAPMSTGGNSYTSPFYVKAFCSSRQIIRTGLVSNMSFTFGDGDAGWTNDRKPLNLKVTMEIIDLEPIMSVPIDRSISLTNPAKTVNMILSDDTAYNSYLARLTGLSYLDTVLKYDRLNRGLTAAYQDLKKSFSSSNIAGKIADTPIKDFLTLFNKPISR